MNLKREAIQKIADATQSSGGAKFPSFMLTNMKGWEKSGLIELHIMGAETPVARVTDKGLKYLAETPANSR